jgi:hypothetical protein
MRPKVVGAWQLRQTSRPAGLLDAQTAACIFSHSLPALRLGPVAAALSGTAALTATSSWSTT